MAYDLLVRGGTLLDPGAPTIRSDIGVRDNTIVDIAPGLDATGAGTVIEADGLLVTPGLVDLHVHSFAGVSHVSFDADEFCVQSGVTTAVDAGSSGMINFAGFRRFIADTARTRMLAFVHVAMYGVMRNPGELVDLGFANVEGTAATIRENRDVAVGVKVRVADHHVNENGPAAMGLAIEAGEQSGTPVMVHIGHSIMSMEEIVGMLRPGDIVTHCYTPLEPTLVGPDGHVRPAVLDAAARGVLFDVGPCDIDFDLDIARTCMDEGLLPTSLSTDAYVTRFPRDVHDEAIYSIAGAIDRTGVDDLPGVITMFLALGMSLEEAIYRSTLAPAAAIGWEDRLGRLAVGREADLSVFELVEEGTVLSDSSGNTINADRRLEARWSVRAGAATRSTEG